MLDANLEKIIIHFLSYKVSPFLIILFGSTVTGTVHKEIDIDIAYLSEKQLDQYEIFMAAQELAAKLNRDVDLIDLSKASTVFKAQVIHTGKSIYCSDSKKKAEFELTALKMYAKLNEERSPILKNIDESGSIYEK